LTTDEVARLLAASPPEHTLVYALAIGSGLWGGEIKGLRVGDLNHKFRCIDIRPEIAKNRRFARQPLARALLYRLAQWANDKALDELLFDCPRDLTKWLDRDLAAAGIPKLTPAGRADFQGLREYYKFALIEAGGTAAEVHELARCTISRLTGRRYTVIRPGWLSALAERVVEAVFFGPTYMTRAEQKVMGLEGHDETEGGMEPGDGIESLGPSLLNCIQQGQPVDLTPDLAHVIEAWPSLPEYVRLAVLALVRSASRGKAERS
jgi:hypothetical protein